MYLSTAGPVTLHPKASNNIHDAIRRIPRCCASPPAPGPFLPVAWGQIVPPPDRLLVLQYGVLLVCRYLLNPFTIFLARLLPIYPSLVCVSLALALGGR